MKSALNLVEQFFLKMMLGGQKFQEGSTMDDAITLLVIFFVKFQEICRKMFKIRYKYLNSVPLTQSNYLMKPCGDFHLSPIFANFGRKF